MTRPPIQTKLFAEMLKSDVSSCDNAVLRNHVKMTLSQEHFSKCCASSVLKERGAHLVPEYGVCAPVGMAVCWCRRERLPPDSSFSLLLPDAVSCNNPTSNSQQNKFVGLDTAELSPRTIYDSRDCNSLQLQKKATQQFLHAASNATESKNDSERFYSRNNK